MFLSSKAAARAAHIGVRLAVGVAIACLVCGCHTNKRPPRATRATPLVVRDVPETLRGTVGAVAQLQGIKPVLASGLGYVVGLNGTGGLPLPADIAAHMEREMRLNGIGPATDLSGTALADQAPADMLKDPNTAVVIVQAAIPPGSPEGTTMDVYVRALNATSLEGGSLWTTQLRLGPPSQFKAIQARVVAEARGPIFINPFAEPGEETSGVTRTSGRVLDGGQVTEAVDLILALDNPSHSLAKAVTDAINSRFPRGRKDLDPTAMGRDGETIKLRIPYEYRDRQAEFLKLVEFLPIDQSYPQAYAKRFTDALPREPGLGDELSWALQAVGAQAKPFLRDLYDYPEVIPRLAALRAGSGLNDPRAVPYLVQIARDGPHQHRTAAVNMLSKIDGGPEIEQTLQGLLTDEDLTVRVAAYEALAERAEQAQLKRLVRQERGERDVTARRPYEYLYNLSRAYLPEGTMQGVSRELVEGKFFLDRVPGGTPMIYITQQHVPRIVLFGEIPLNSPVTATMWSDRLMFVSDTPGDPVRVYYRTLPQMRNGEPVDGSSRVVTQELQGDIVDLIRFMAHDPTPEDPRPGLGLSYSEVVGALYGLYKSDAVAANFSTERDRLLAEIVSISDQPSIQMRPERPGEKAELVVFDDPTRLPAGNALRDTSVSSLLVPLRPPATSDGGAASGESGGG